MLFIEKLSIDALQDPPSGNWGAKNQPINYQKKKENNI